MQQYPTKFDLIYGFECQSDLSDVSLMRPSIEKCIQGTTAEQRGYRTEEILNTLKVQYSYVGLVDNPSAKPPTVGLSKFIHDIGVKEDDFVVLKMDVEELEFDLLEQIMKDGTYKLLDEVRKMKKVSPLNYINNPASPNFYHPSTGLRRGSLQPSRDAPLGLGEHQTLPK